MKTTKKTFAIITVAYLLLAGTSLAMADDQDRTQDRAKDQKQDGSCQEYTENSQLHQLLVKYGNDGGNGDATRDRDQDGSCLDG